jgi:hypothetical protein
VVSSRPPRFNEPEPVFEIREHGFGVLFSHECGQHGLAWCRGGVIGSLQALPRDSLRDPMDQPIILFMAFDPTVDFIHIAEHEVWNSFW